MKSLHFITSFAVFSQALFQGVLYSNQHFVQRESWVTPDLSFCRLLCTASPDKLADPCTLQPLSSKHRPFKRKQRTEPFRDIGILVAIDIQELWRERILL